MKNELRMKVYAPFGNHHDIVFWEPNPAWNGEMFLNVNRGVSKHKLQKGDCAFELILRPYKPIGKRK